MLGLLTLITTIGDVLMIPKKTRIVGAILALVGGISLQVYGTKCMNELFEEKES